MRSFYALFYCALCIRSYYALFLCALFMRSFYAYCLGALFMHSFYLPFSCASSESVIAQKQIWQITRWRRPKEVKSV